MPMGDADSAAGGAILMMLSRVQSGDRYLADSRVNKRQWAKHEEMDVRVQLGASSIESHKKCRSRAPEWPTFFPHKLGALVH
jgi:hypothetical protein